MLGFLRRHRHPLELHAEQCANIIQHQLTRLNLCYRESRDGVQSVQRVEFVEPLIATPGEIRLEVDVNRLPRAVTITDLRDSKVLETLSVACKHPVRAEHKKGKGAGFWIVVELEDRATIPRMVKFDAMRPPEKAPALLIPIGVGENGSQRWEDLRKLPHLLIAGATGQGKSVMVNAILCWLVRRLDESRLNLYLVDLKGGMEMGFYDGLPHVKKVITRNNQLPVLLAWLQGEMDRRTGLMQGIARDIDDYNAAQAADRRLPYIVVVVDEIANAMLARSRCAIVGTDLKGTIGALTNELLSDIAARARATGIHLIVSTQRPSVDVVTGLIKANFPCRVAFGTASEVDSRVIVDDGSAHGLSAGRMKFRRNMDLIELQAPYLSDAEVQKHVAAATAGERIDTAPTPDELRRMMIALLLSIAESEFGGKFPIKDLVARTKLPHNKVESIAKALEAEKILKKPIGPRARFISVPPAQWKAKYPPALITHSS